jgi:hypothetical protein
LDCQEKMSLISSEVSLLGIPMRGKYFSGSFYTRLVLSLHILCVPSRSKLSKSKRQDFFSASQHV